MKIPGDDEGERRDVGVGEVVNLTYEQPCGQVQWHCDAGKFLDENPSGATVTWQAPDRGNPAVEIRAVGENGTATITFQVLEPSDIKMEAYMRLHHKDESDIGMRTLVFAFPDYVSFCNIQIQEIAGTWEADVPGNFAEYDGFGHESPGVLSGTASVVCGQGTVMTGWDMI